MSPPGSSLGEGCLLWTGHCALVPAEIQQRPGVLLSGAVDQGASLTNVDIARTRATRTIPHPRMSSRSRERLSGAKSAVSSGAFGPAPSASGRGRVLSLAVLDDSRICRTSRRRSAVASLASSKSLNTFVASDRLPTATRARTSTLINRSSSGRPLVSEQFVAVVGGGQRLDPGGHRVAETQAVGAAQDGERRRVGVGGVEPQADDVGELGGEQDVVGRDHHTYDRGDGVVPDRRAEEA